MFYERVCRATAQAVFSLPNKICLCFSPFSFALFLLMSLSFFFISTRDALNLFFDICISWLDKSVLTPAVSLSPSELAVQKEKLMPPLTRVSLFQAHRLTLSNMAK